MLFLTSRHPSGDHPEEHLKHFTSILQADAYAGYNRLLVPDRQPGPIIEALCWAHARRKFFVLADSSANIGRDTKAAPISPIAFEAVTRIDAFFDIEREINGAQLNSAWPSAGSTAPRSSLNSPLTSSKLPHR